MFGRDLIFPTVRSPTALTSLADASQSGYSARPLSSHSGICSYPISTVTKLPAPCSEKRRYGYLDLTPHEWSLLNCLLVSLDCTGYWWDSYWASVCCLSLLPPFLEDMYFIQALHHGCQPSVCILHRKIPKAFHAMVRQLNENPDRHCLQWYFKYLSHTYSLVSKSPLNPTRMWKVDFTPSDRPSTVISAQYSHRFSISIFFNTFSGRMVFEHPFSALKSEDILILNGILLYL